MEITRHKKFRVVFGVIITIGLIMHLLWYFKSHPHFADQILSSLWSVGEEGMVILFSILIGLSIMNWGLESLKWKILSQPIQKITFSEAVSDVLAGLIISSFLPRSASDLIGRIGRKEKKSKWELFGALVVNNLSQLSITLLFGIIGMVVISRSYFDLPWIYLFIVSIVMLLLCIISFVFRVWLIRVIVGKFPKLLKTISAIKEYSFKTISKVSVLSLLRYLIFSFQMMLVLYFQGNEYSFMEFIVPISLIFLTKTLLPSFNFLTDLGIRQYSHVFFFEYLSIGTADATSTGLIIWMVNICIPSFVGLFFLWKR